MPRWSNEPPPEAEEFAHRIIRTPAGKPLCGIITSPDLIGCPTHYFNHRTVPCEDPNPCEACTEGHSRRWHGYVSVLVTGTLEHAILELTSFACQSLKHYAKIHNSLRACNVRASRPSGRANGRVNLELKALEESRLRLPEPFNVLRVMCHIWNVPYVETDRFASYGPPLDEIGRMPLKGDGKPRPPKPK